MASTKERIAKLEKEIEALKSPPDVKAESSPSNVGKLRVVVRWNDGIQYWTAKVEECVTDYDSYTSWGGVHGEKWELLGRGLEGESRYVFSGLDREKVALLARDSARSYKKRCKKNSEDHEFLKAIKSDKESVVYL